METLERQFNSRVSGFLEETGMGATTLGLKAVGDPNLLREIAEGRSPSLRIADQVLAFINSHERDSFPAASGGGGPDGSGAADDLRPNGRGDLPATDLAGWTRGGLDRGRGRGVDARANREHTGRRARRRPTEPQEGENGMRTLSRTTLAAALDRRCWC